MNERMALMKPKPGDIYCVYNDSLQKYTACQVTKVHKPFRAEQAVLLTFDWSGDEPLTEADFGNLQPLYEDFMFLNGELSLRNVDPQVPANYIYVGNCPPFCDHDSNAYSSWDNGYIMWQQMHWRQLPEPERRAFKAAAASREKTVLGGQELPVNLHALREPTFSFENALELRALPCLSALHCTRWHKGLYEYLQGNLFLRELRLEGHGQRTLDFRGSHLQRLMVDLTDVDEIWLNDDLGMLLLLNTAPEHCRIHAKAQGEGLGLHQKTLTLHPELPGLSELHLREVQEIDLAQLYQTYPRLQGLRLWGAPGYIRNFAALPQFKELHRFSTVDMFGFTAGDIPKPEQMKKLTWFWMESLPEDAAQAVKQLYKKRKAQGLDLRIRKARKPQWLAENLDNPFRHWDGAEHIPASSAKKAAAQYKKTRAGLLALADEQTEDIMQRALDAVTCYAQTFNKMRFIETEEREEIYSALHHILNSVFGDCIDKDVLLEQFEWVRDF